MHKNPGNGATPIIMESRSVLLVSADDGLAGIVGSLVISALKVLLAVLLLTGCSHDADRASQKKLSGTWHQIALYEHGGRSEIATTIASDGSYVSDIIFHNSDSTTGTNKTEGTMRVKDGVLVATVTRYKGTNMEVPMVTRARIVRIDDRELVLDPEKDGSVRPTNEMIFRRQR
jgi:hypothetical protein